MRADAALADRRREVRLAARGWRRAGAIDDATLASIDAAYPDDRARLGPVFRTLAFVLGLLALNAFFGLIALASGSSGGFGAACLVFSLLLVAATEVLVGPLKRADSGIETATALLSRRLRGRRPSASCSRRPCRTSAWSASCWPRPRSSACWAARAGARRSSPLVAGACALRLPRAAALGAAPLDGRLGGRRPTPPPRQRVRRAAAVHRRSCRLGLVLALCAFYVAVHVGLAGTTVARVARRVPGRGLAPACVAAPAVDPGHGARARRRPRLRRRHPPCVPPGPRHPARRRLARHAPLLRPRGAGVGGARRLRRGGPRCHAAVRRLLAGGPGGERGGFTAEPLFEDPTRRHAAEMVGTVAAFAPTAAAVPAAAGRPGRLEPGGGRYGGGGATSDF